LASYLLRLNNLNIGFILPSGKANYKPFRNQPLMVLYLMTILEERFGDSINLELIDLRCIEPDSFMFHIPEKDIYMYSVATPDFNEISGIVKELRTIYPKAVHVAGGAHITLFPDECSQVFDSIVLGEGESNIYWVVNDFEAGALAKRYDSDGVVNLDEYPMPNRKWLPRKAVVDTGLLEGEHSDLPGAAVLFSRGCSFKCHFCANGRLTYGAVRFRSPELIEQEIEYLKKEYGVQALALKDDNSIPTSVKWARPLLEAIGKTNVKWRGQSRANGVHPDMVKLAKESGCVDIALGIESSSQEVLQGVNKTIDLEKAKDYIRLLRNTGIGVRLHFIIGLPNEPEDIVKRTLKFIDESQPKSVLLSYLCPLPGSELFDNPDKFGIRITERNWDKYTLTAGRFDGKELPTFVFEYKNGMSTETIFRNYTELQSILRERGLNF
jgi:anaerobic magnesium-protoporphyrin IX monomethyl ester cyclase